MFESLDMAPPDAILGLTEAFNNDPNPHKINLSVGVYKDASGKTPVLASVKDAEAEILQSEASKSYRPIPGNPAYARLVRELLFGQDHPLVDGGRAVTAHTPGGTAALRVAGDLLHRKFPGANLWLPDPTWANHKGIFTAAGMKLRTYPYFDPDTGGVDFDGMIRALESAPAGDVVLLHACCQNPTGADLTAEQWSRLARTLESARALPLVDFAYQGFGDGMRQDAAGVRTLADALPEMIVCSSFSKNFSLYNERVGAVTFLAAAPEDAARLFSHVKICIRTNYSNPPAHGESIVVAILDDDRLRETWSHELAQMRDRINGMRHALVKALRKRNVPRDFSFIENQRGMFSYSGLDKNQVDRLREKHSIYVVGSGRINVAGMTDDNVDRVADAIADVLEP